MYLHKKKVAVAPLYVTGIDDVDIERQEGGVPQGLKVAGVQGSESCHGPGNTPNLDKIESVGAKEETMEASI